MQFISRQLRVARLYGAISALAMAGLMALLLVAPMTSTPVHAANNWCHWVGDEWICENVVPFDYDRWTAIAVSGSTSAWGTSWNAHSRGEAEQLALHQCAMRAGDCRIQEWGLNMCLALARGTDLSWAVDMDRNGKRAQAKALAGCYGVKGQNCKIVADPCAHDDW